MIKKYIVFFVVFFVLIEEPGYLGCFKDIIDTFRDRALSNGPQNPYQLTIEKCVNACKSKGFFYAGVEYNVECFCGAQAEDYSRHGRVSDEQCGGTGCGGDYLESCGAPYRIAVYLAGPDKCDDLRSPANGFMLNDSLQYGVGSKVYFNCSDGFVLEGANVIQCVETYVRGAIVTRESISNQPALMWNDSLPNCAGIRLTTPSIMTTLKGATVSPVTSFGTRDPTKQEGVLATIITIAILVTLIVIAVLVFIVWRRGDSGDGRGPGDGRGTVDGQAATSVYQPLNEPAHDLSGIRTGLNVDGYYEEINVDNEYYEINVERDPEEQGRANHLGQEGDEMKASLGVHGNPKDMEQLQEIAGNPIENMNLYHEYYEINVERDPEEQGRANHLGQEGDEMKASPGIHGNQRDMEQLRERAGHPLEDIHLYNEYMDFNAEEAVWTREQEPNEQE